MKVYKFEDNTTPKKSSSIKHDKDEVYGITQLCTCSDADRRPTHDRTLSNNTVNVRCLNCAKRLTQRAEDAYFQSDAYFQRKAELDSKTK